MRATRLLGLPNNAATFIKASRPLRNRLSFGTESGCPNNQCSWIGACHSTLRIVLYIPEKEWSGIALREDVISKMLGLDRHVVNDHRKINMAMMRALTIDALIYTPWLLDWQ
ncbi:hypothetical protein KCU81_g257, partial [Aureobasidium melanogenum]